MDVLNTHLLINLPELLKYAIITILFKFTTIILASFLYMGDGSSTGKEMDNLTSSISSTSFSRDLLQRFLGNSSNNSSSTNYDGSNKVVNDNDDGDDEIELNLGLSLGGRFGIDKSAGNLIRSSSIASCLPVVVKDENEVVTTQPVAYAGLMRTSSLPVETEEEWRKRKELQTMRRMEAKRRRSEKQRNLRGSGSVSRSGSLSLEERKEIEVHLREKLDRDKYLGAVRKLRTTIGSQSDLMMIRGGSDVGVVRKGKGSSSSGGQEGSVESKGAGSSSLSDLESKSLQGSTGEPSPPSIQSVRDSTTRARESTSSTAGPETESSSKRPETSRAQGREIGTNSLGDMPCVFTTGDGPNGRRVDGILYKYGKGEEVRIMCVCHGNFHSPAEFVKHAGGTDVDHPLKHIVIKPSS